MNNGSSHLKPEFGFTIVELLVVIVVIGILAAITIVSYTGITQRAVASSLQSDLTNASQQLKLYYQLYSSYPTAMTGNCPTAPTADSTYCLKASNGNTLTYSSNNGTTFALTETNTNSTAYGINDTSSLVALAQPTNCPTGFIPVPGSATYGQAGFCVMQYEAKNDGSNNAVSTATGIPWVNISQPSAITTAAAVCSSCHLITEAEWMTIVQNVVSVASNWYGGVVGANYIYNGHNDNQPASALAADPSDANGYASETNTGGNQRRTLTLTNGQIIWDLAGNVDEWTSGTITGSQPGIVGNNYGWIEWNSVTTPGILSVNPFPSGTGVTGINSLNSTNGIGELSSNTSAASQAVFIRGGVYNQYNTAGIFMLTLNFAPSGGLNFVGFRVSR